MMKLLRGLVVGALLALLFHGSIYIVDGQAEATSVQCGTKLEAEFTSDNTKHDYTIELNAGDTLNILAQPIGNILLVEYYLFAPNNNNREIGSNQFNPGAKDSKSIVVSATGTYRVHLEPYNNLGAYTLNVGCTLRNGTVIKPGDIVTPTTPSPPTVVPTLSPQDSEFRGFPGLAPVDFANAFTNDLTPGQPIKAKIPPSGDAVLGYTFEANANDNLALGFTRVSGNLNLGLVVLSADNKVVFQASLVTSSELTTKLTLPSDGTYTIGIFRIDLLPPASPEATAFQLTATLNP